MSIELGDRVKDSITGLTGIAVASTKWLHGCERITVQPEALTADGGVPETVTFDALQLFVLHEAAVTTGNREKGGPRPEPTRNPGPVR